ncbi:MAG: murein L,D-transpeptidase [Hyphomicrobiales bacterium]|nr:murein L,D-transpeptidase [Hyphomicrobiales bacterium]
MSLWDGMMSRTPIRFLIAAAALSLLGACNDPEFRGSNARHWVPLTQELLASMQEKGMRKEDPVLIRTYKQEAEFEVWKKDGSGRFALLKTFPMCRWSGQLGPKRKEGDRQAPEGYYAITPAQMNPNSNYHLSYDMGYPNAYDRAHGGTGSYLMVHGDCSSAGCYSMTDQQIEEIYALVREAHSGGQKAVQMEAFPFRFTAANLARHRLDPNMPFWRELKEGADRFEITKQEPKVGVCNGHYAFDRASKNGEAAGCGSDSDPELTKQVAEKRAEDNAKVAELVGKGVPAVKLAYDDGGQNPSFRFKTIETSRPEAIAEGPTIELFDAKGALTKVAVRARGFDEESIAAAVKDVGSPSTASTVVATSTPVAAPTQAKASSASVVSASASSGASHAAATPSSAPAATGVTVILANSSHSSGASSASGRDTTPSTGAHATLAAFASPGTEATSGQDAPFYQRILAKLPFPSSNDAQAQSNAEPQDALDPQAPLPPVRPSTLSRDTKPSPASPQASVAPELDLFSSHAIFAALPRFSRGSPATAPTTATGFAPVEP